jgi:hypothetical protein
MAIASQSVTASYPRTCDRYVDKVYHGKVRRLRLYSDFMVGKIAVDPRCRLSWTFFFTVNLDNPTSSFLQESHFVEFDAIVTIDGRVSALEDLRRLDPDAVQPERDDLPRVAGTIRVDRILRWRSHR